MRNRMTSDTDPKFSQSGQVSYRTVSSSEKAVSAASFEDAKLILKDLMQEFGQYFDSLRNSDSAPNQPGLLTHSLLKNFEYFRTFPSALVSSVHVQSNLLSRLESQIKLLGKLNSVQSPEDLASLTLNKIAPFAESESSDIFINTMSELQKILSGARGQTSASGCYQRLLTNIYGISLPSNKTDKYPLHRAVFQSNLPLIRRICIQELGPYQYHPVDQPDLLGVTPLMLAVKLGRKDAVFILCEHGADPKLRTHPLARTPFEEAIIMKSQTIIKYMIIASHRRKQSQWEAQKGNIVTALRSFPDISCEMICEFDSKFVPFVKRFTPFYKYIIKKQKSNLRIDIHLGKGHHNHSEMTAYFLGEGTGELSLAFPSKKKCIDLLSDLSQAQLEENYQQLVSKTSSAAASLKQEIKFENFKASPAVNWRGHTIHEKIGSRPSTKYAIKGEIEAFSLKKDFLSDIAWKDLRSFDEYFDIMMRSPLFQEVFETEPGEISEPVTLISKAATKASAETRKNVESARALEKRNTYINSRVKTINADVWFCDELPLKIKHLLPILEVLGYFSSNMVHFKEFIASESLSHLNAFPIKAVIPLYYTLNTAITFTDISFDFLDPAHFVIDPFFKDSNQLEVLTPRLKTEEIHALSKNIAKSLLKNPDANSQLTDSQNNLNLQWENFLQQKSEDGPQIKLSESDDSLEEAKKRYEFLLENKKSDSSDLFDVFNDGVESGTTAGRKLNDNAQWIDSPELDFSEKKKNSKPLVPCFDTKNLKELDDKFLKRQNWVKAGLEKIARLHGDHAETCLTNKIKETREIRPFADMNTPRSLGSKLIADGKASPYSKENKATWGPSKEKSSCEQAKNIGDPIPGLKAQEDEFIQIKHQNFELINDQAFFRRMTNLLDNSLGLEEKRNGADKEGSFYELEELVKSPTMKSQLSEFPEENKKKVKNKAFLPRHKIKDVDITLSSFKKSNKK